MKIAITFWLILLCFYGESQNIKAESPSVTLNPFTLHKSQFQLESGLSASARFHNSNPISYLYNAPSLLLRYGINNRIELRAEAHYTMNHNVSSGIQVFRVSGVDVGAKFQFLHEKKENWNVGFIAHLNVFNQGSPFYGGHCAFAYHHHVAMFQAIDVNIGIGHLMRRMPGLYQGMTTPRISAMYTYFAAEKLDFFGEVFWTASNSVINNYGQVIKLDYVHDYAFRAGLKFRPKKHIQLDAAIGSNFSFENLFASIGFNIFIPKSRRPGDHPPIIIPLGL